MIWFVKYKGNLKAIFRNFGEIIQEKYKGNLNLEKIFTYKQKAKNKWFQKNQKDKKLNFCKN